jgi:hypothetical protein
MPPASFLLPLLTVAGEVNDLLIQSDYTRGDSFRLEGFHLSSILAPFLINIVTKREGDSSSEAGGNSLNENVSC